MDSKFKNAIDLLNIIVAMNKEITHDIENGDFHRAEILKPYRAMLLELIEPKQ